MDTPDRLVWTHDSPGPLPAHEARLSPLDLGYLRGESLYETLRTYHARPFAVEDHLDRLEAGLRRVGILPPARGVLVAALQGLAARRAPAESSLRIQVSPGCQFPWESRVGPACWTAFAGPLPAHVSALYERGVRCILSRRRRLNPGGFHPAVKFASNPEMSLASAEADHVGAYEALLCAPSGELAEATRANVFLVDGRRVVTPHLEAGILDGVTRSRILGLCPRAGLEAVERRVEVSELWEADEVFLTATTHEVVPVVRIDDRLIGRGEPGLIADRLLGMYQEAALESTRGVL